MVEPVDASKEDGDLRETWQARVLKETVGSKLGLVVCSMLDHAFETEVLLILLRVVFPGFVRLKPPFLCTCGRIALNGNIIADVCTDVGASPLGQHFVRAKKKNMLLFSSKLAMQSAFHKLADRLALNDHDRREMFSVLQKWVVADYRRNPRMDPRDPDAIRHAVH